MFITTSAKDDHESQRSRKQLQPMLKNGLEPKRHAENRAKEPAGKGVSIPEKKCQKEENVSHLNESVDDLKRNTEDRIDSIKEPSVDVSSVKAIINNKPRNDIKVNPWIAEQAKLVLASRGKQALEKSLQKKKDSATKKNDEVIVKDDNKCLSKGIPSFKNIKPTIEVPRLSKEAAMKAEKISPSSGTKHPAYQRFGHLLEAKKPEADQATHNLPLPYHFKMLEEMFRCVDVVLSLKQKRHESCTFEKLKYSVQEMTRKKFEKKHLAQIKTIYPDAFVFRQQSTLVEGKKSSFQLTISLNLNGKHAKDVKFVESFVFTERLKHFKNKLLEVTMEHHQDYLAKNYPRLCVKNVEIMRWHPCFPLDKIPELEQAALPQPPQMETFTSARDVLDKARLNMSPRVENALKNVAQSSLEKNSDNTQSKTNKFEMNSNQAAKSHNPSLRGVSQSLIDKIRLKEEKKIQEALTVDSEVVKKRAMLQRLPEFSRILKTYFVGERKVAIPLEDVIGKIAESFTSTMSTVEVEKHVRLLCETLPEWLSITHVRKCPYVKLKKNVNFNSLVEKLKAKERN